MITWIQVSSGKEQILSVMPSYNKERIVYKDIPPAYDYYDTTEEYKFLFTFDSITAEYTYIDFGGIYVSHEAVSRSNYPLRVRIYNKGKLVNNTFSWYSYQEKIDKNKTVVFAGDGNSNYQLNCSQSDYYRKYYWICV